MPFWINCCSSTSCTAGMEIVFVVMAHAKCRRAKHLYAVDHTKMHYYFQLDKRYKPRLILGHANIRLEHLDINVAR